MCHATFVPNFWISSEKKSSGWCERWAGAGLHFRKTFWNLVRVSRGDGCKRIETALQSTYVFSVILLVLASTPKMQPRNKLKDAVNIGGCVDSLCTPKPTHYASSVQAFQNLRYSAVNVVYLRDLCGPSSSAFSTPVTLQWHNMWCFTPAAELLWGDISLCNIKRNWLPFSIAPFRIRPKLNKYNHGQREFFQLLCTHTGRKSCSAFRARRRPQTCQEPNSSHQSQ